VTGKEFTHFDGGGNGRLDAVSNALQNNLPIHYKNLNYSEHALDQGKSAATAMAYIGLTADDNTAVWGAGTDTDIITASVKALVSAINNMAAGDS
jgi:2-isopropylmalate synthase